MLLNYDFGTQILGEEFLMDHFRSLFHLFSSYLTFIIYQTARIELGPSQQKSRTLTTRPPPRPILGEDLTYIKIDQGKS